MRLKIYDINVKLGHRGTLRAVTSSGIKDQDTHCRNCVMCVYGVWNGHNVKKILLSSFKMIHHHATEGGAASASLTCKSMNWSAIAGTLYGRDDLLEQLSTAYAKSSCRPHQTMVDTRIELVLIAGSSGGTSRVNIK
jgi:hypothetical protein